MRKSWSASYKFNNSIFHRKLLGMGERSSRLARLTMGRKISILPTEIMHLASRESSLGIDLASKKDCTLIFLIAFWNHGRLSLDCAESSARARV